MLCRPMLCALLAVHPMVLAEVPDPAIERRTIEDDGVRIEELRVRGVNRSLLVQPKAASAPAYRILPSDPSRDAAQDRRLQGQRVWSVLSF